MSIVCHEIPLALAGILVGSKALGSLQFVVKPGQSPRFIRRHGQGTRGRGVRAPLAASLVVGVSRLGALGSLSCGVEAVALRLLHELVTVLIKNAMSRLLRCQQIAGGHCKSEIGDMIYWPDNPKVRELVEIAGQSGDQRIIVFSRFIEDLEQGRKAIEKAGFSCEVYHGGVKHEERARIENEFLKDRTPLKAVLVQVKTGGFGIDFSKASIAIFYNNWFSWAVRDQAQSRLHRLGQTRNVLCIDLIGKRTVDETILETVLSKRSLSEVLFGKKVAAVEKEIDRLDEIISSVTV